MRLRWFGGNRFWFSANSRNLVLKTTVAACFPFCKTSILASCRQTKASCDTVDLFAVLGSEEFAVDFGYKMAVVVILRSLEKRVDCLKFLIPLSEFNLDSQT